jgi:hypothetical protein
MACTPRETMSGRCPSEFALERYLFDRKRNPYASHIRACAICLVRLAMMEQKRREFLDDVYPSTVGQVEHAAQSCGDADRPVRRRTRNGRIVSRRSNS